MKKYKEETRLCHDDREYFQHHGAIVPPIYQTSLFAFESWDHIDKAFDHPAENYIYSRGMNPTVHLAEKKLATLCCGEKAKLMASGMGAISAAILHCVNHGDHILTLTNIYGPANNFIGEYLTRKCGIEVTYVQGTNLSQFAKNIRKNTKLIYLESPTSMTFELQDIRQVTDLAKTKGIFTVMDNTWASPIFQKSLEMGIDIEVHSVSKYIGGHSDVVAGLLVGSAAIIDQIIVEENALLGSKMSPFEAWLILRSLRTLPIRMRTHQQNALHLASFLENSDQVRKVYFPGLKSHPQNDLAQMQMTGFGGLLSFELKTYELGQVRKFVDNLELFKLGVSWGGYESLVYAPTISYIKELPPEKFKAMDMPVGLIRLSIGLENKEDQVNDLIQALASVG